MTPFAETVKAAEVDFGMRASGFATRVIGGTVPANSGMTALSVVACTREVPTQDTGSLASINLESLVQVHGATTNNRTVEGNGRVWAISRTEVADVFVGPNAQNRLHLEGLFTEVRTWHAPDGFHRKTALGIADVSLMLGGLPVPPIAIPDITEGEVIEIPGIARIAAGPTTGATTSTLARGSRLMLDIQLLQAVGDPIRVLVGKANARIESGFTGGVFSGGASAFKASLLDGTVTLGPIAPRPVPCKGTGGEWLENGVDVFNAAPVAGGSDASAQVSGLQGANSAIGRGRADIAVINFLGFPLTIENIGARTYVRKNGNGTYFRNMGFEEVTITYDGEEIEPPDPGVPLVIPGVGSIRVGLRQNRPKGVLATGVRIVLLDDTVIDLAQVATYVG